MFLEDTFRESQDEWAQYRTNGSRTTEWINIIWFSRRLNIPVKIMASPEMPKHIRELAKAWGNSQFAYTIDLQEFINTATGEYDDNQ